MPSESQRESLPFEPKSNKQSSSQKASSSSSSSVGASTSLKQGVSKASALSKDEAGIPEVVSRRMMRRMAIFAGVPTFLGMSSFVIFYILLTQHIAEFPNVVVLIVSLSLFGLGTIGLSYGVLSASWQEDVEGSLLGVSEFSVNFRRLIQGLRKQPPSESEQ
ncbi:PAM68 family protein [Leptothoe spongobia]|uniref:PAM68 family protein n=1 Tax=Leptothoe spongobia TAU-MAC 1115 TaxID=1967444 RepID=A0A947DG14_9CYAN|nr:PAM68 family protein [Leptothoe spongobia]MBT9315246.1 PAM68 family protein [Leptothoe spongobia TAU-MAC 1115]